MSTEAMRAAFDKSYPKDGADLAMYENNSDYVLESIGARHRFAAFELGWKAATLAERERIKCWCETCRPIRLGEDMRMVLCPTCGNKRCPHATDHRNACTGSNEPGQPGSSYENCKPFEAIRKGETP